MAENRISIGRLRNSIHGLLHAGADPYIVTEAGVPTAVLLNYEEYSSLKAMEALFDRPDIVKHVRKGQLEILAGKKISLEDAMQLLSCGKDDSVSDSEEQILSESDEDPIPEMINELNDLENYYKAGRLEPDLISCLAQNLAQLRSLREVVRDEGERQSEQLQAES